MLGKKTKRRATRARKKVTAASRCVQGCTARCKHRKAKRSEQGDADYHRRNVILDQDLALRVMDWHGGQGSMVYSLASTGYAGKLVSPSMIDAAVGELERDLAGANAEEKRDLDEIIGELDGVARGSWEHTYLEATGEDIDDGTATWLQSRQRRGGQPGGLRVYIADQMGGPFQVKRLTHTDRAKAVTEAKKMLAGWKDTDDTWRTRTLDDDTLVEIMSFGEDTDIYARISEKDYKVAPGSGQSTSEKARRKRRVERGDKAKQKRRKKKVQHKRSASAQRILNTALRRDT